MSKYLVTIALKEESQNVFENIGVEVIYTGLGKVNAAYRLTKEIARLTDQGNRPRGVLNFGTAGSFTFKTHDVVECTHFVQRDMDVTALGLTAGVTPFETVPAVLEVPALFPWLPKGRCGTGDRFETSAPSVPCDVVDMEAYALAKVCHLEKVGFASVKYITDGSDHGAANDWKENLPRAAEAFLRTYRRFMDS